VAGFCHNERQRRGPVPPSAGGSGEVRADFVPFLIINVADNIAA
jgi:hypothetical protein